MAVKKSKKTEVVVETPNVEIDTEAVEEVVEEVIETEEKTSDFEVEVVPEVVEEAKPATTSSNGNVRIRMAKKHVCFIGGTRYFLEAGQCYNVPANVKDILNRAGLLSPL